MLLLQVCQNVFRFNSIFAERYKTKQTQIKEKQTYLDPRCLAARNYGGQGT